MSNTPANAPQTQAPQEISPREMGALVASLDRASFSLSGMSMSLSADGSFTLNIPMGPFVVSGTGAAAPMATLTVTPPWSGAVSPTTTVTSPLGPSSVSATGNHSVAMDEGAGVVDPTLFNDGPTPAEVAETLASLEESDSESEGGSGWWYTVTRGVDVGVFRHHDEVSPLTNGISGSSQKKYRSKAKAIRAYTRAWNNGTVRRI